MISNVDRYRAAARRTRRRPARAARRGWVRVADGVELGYLAPGDVVPPDDERNPDGTPIVPPGASVRRRCPSRLLWLAIGLGVGRAWGLIARLA